MDWHSSCIYKHAFCLWLAIMVAHRTRDKLLLLGIVDSALCPFNCGENESTEHLFFACPFTQQIWMQILNMCNVKRQIAPWSDEIQWMIDHSRGNKFPQTLRKLAFAATIYHVWMERNRRCFKNNFLNPDHIIHKIQGHVAAKLWSQKNPMVQAGEHYLSLGCNWGLFG
ncbi:zf-RVT domain-containing protein [Cephalotus follicularis]|uniref:Zf-RVT domain-containing protein n=1 Tax=Cephalotus follicularis TaxID=3775 RepID=A0A1Q3DBN9_CEPFO|nr:zf-RVT domain-containing protein [Cephalotus follicularis]